MPPWTIPSAELHYLNALPVTASLHKTLVIEGKSKLADYYRAHHRVDIMLDPFPYNGTTTADSLWMGVPVLTLRGQRYSGHMAEAVLHQADLSSWVAPDTDTYIRNATHHTNNLTILATLRRTLRDKIKASPLMNGPAFAADFVHFCFLYGLQKMQKMQPALKVCFLTHAAKNLDQICPDPST